MEGGPPPGNEVRGAPRPAGLGGMAAGGNAGESRRALQVAGGQENVAEVGMGRRGEGAGVP